MLCGQQCYLTVETCDPQTYTHFSSFRLPRPLHNYNGVAKNQSGAV